MAEQSERRRAESNRPIGYEQLTDLSIISMLFRKKSPEHFANLSRVREWTRARFALSDSTVISVSEIACRLPGCPPIETVINFWVDDRRYHFKVFKPVAFVIEDDIPPAWLMGSLVVAQGIECDCC